MVYNRFYLGIWLRVIFLTSTIFLFCWVLMNTSRFYTILLLAGIILAQVWELVHYQNKTNFYLSRFLINLREQNLSFRLNPNQEGSSFRDLTNILTEIQAIVAKANLEKEKQFHYLNYVVSNLDVGVITFYSTGKVELCNETALKMLGYRSISQLRDLNSIYEGLGDFVLSLRGGQHALFRITQGNKVNNLSFRCGEFRIGTIDMKLVSFQDIHTELEEQELDSWQKLIRVLTHEIMNSITPVNTLAQALIRQLRIGNTTIDIKDIEQEMLAELITGLEMIEERGTGLLEFVEKFRSLTRMPLPQFKIIEMDDVIEKLLRLFRPELTLKDIKTNYLPLIKDLTILADEKLLLQSLINLLKNAMEAIDNRSIGQIIITTGINERNRTFISINDNGDGILADNMDKVFVPFFTTKESGSGIGLSFARQVMRLHKGSIHLESKPEKGTTVYLMF